MPFPPFSPFFSKTIDILSQQDDLAAIELDLVKFLKNLENLEEQGVTEEEFADLYSLNFIAQTNRGGVVCFHFLLPIHSLIFILIFFLNIL